MEAIVLAGGLGTRLAGVVKDVPKPMAPAGGRPFLEYLLDDLIRQGVTRVILAVCHKKEVIMEHFGTRYGGASLSYSVEDVPLFTGGAVKKALTLCRDEYVWVFNGDSFFRLPLDEMKRFAEAQKCPVTIAVKRMKEFSRYGSVEVNTDHRVTAFREKCFCAEGWINGGVYLLESHSLDTCPDSFSMENDCFPKLLTGRGIAAFQSDGPFIDIGVPDDYEAAQRFFT